MVRLIHGSRVFVIDLVFFFFFNDTATTEIYTLSLHDALPICRVEMRALCPRLRVCGAATQANTRRSEEHTSELQSQSNLVCRLLLEKKKCRTSTTSSRTKRTRCSSSQRAPAVP